MKKVFFAVICILSFIGNVQSQNEWNVQLNQSFLNCDGNQVCYQIELENASTTDWALGDQNYRLFFDGDLMTVVSVTSLLPSTFYNPVVIDQNIKISGQGQEAASPLDDIDDNLGFLDFSIVQSNKSNPAAAVQITNTFTPIAEICVDITAAATDECLSFYHSRPSTSGSITNQYTTISENNTPNNTVATDGNNHDDLNQEDGDVACFDAVCSGSRWGIQLNRSALDCNNNQVCYHLQVKSNATHDWTLGDQNYRFFFDGDLMTVSSVTSLLSNPSYSGVTINQNIKISGQGQEAASPLDDIDDNLGFLDFSIVQTDKSNPAAAVQLSSTTYTSVAEICIDVADAAINDPASTNCLSLYHSRASTAGTFTNQYITLTENDAPGTTTNTTGNAFDDLNASDGSKACLSQDCVTGDCSFYATVLSSNCCKPCPDGNLQVRAIYWLETNVDLVSTNVALHKPSQFNGHPRLDNNNAHQVTNGQFEGEPVGNYDYSSSTMGINNRWDLDLIGNYDLESLNIYTKTGCCANGANTYHIFISPNQFTSDNLQTLLNDASIQQYSLPVQAGTTPMVINNLNTTARFVRIYLEGESQMQLVEVEVIGSGNPNSSPYQYSWSDSNIGNNPQPTCLSAGTYEVTITDTETGCTAVKTETVEN